LKYDFKSVGVYGIPVGIMLLVCAVLGLGGGYLLVYSEFLYMGGESTDAVEKVLIWSVVLVILAIFGAWLGMQIVILKDYYRSLVTDEGYLTFTLPVTSRQILLSKLLNAGIWNVILVVLVAVIYFTVVLGVIVGTIQFGDITAMGEDTELYYVLDAMFTNYANGVLRVIGAVAYFVNEQLLYFLGIFLGAVIAQKHKVMAAVGCIAGINFVYGIVRSIAKSFVYSLIGIPASDLWTYSEQLVKSDNILVILEILGLSAVSVIFFFTTSYLMDKKLNLA
jgi:hypothetical protein